MAWEELESYCCSADRNHSAGVVARTQSVVAVDFVGTQFAGTGMAVMADRSLFAGVAFAVEGSHWSVEAVVMAGKQSFVAPKQQEEQN